MTLPWFLIVKCLFCWWLIDIVSGVYHYATDRGWNVRSQVMIFHEHHERPADMVFDPLPILAAIPIAALGLLWADAFIFAACVALLQVPHLLVHRGADNWLLRVLRASGAFISPEEHAAHHQGDFGRNFCVVTNWNNWWFNRIVGSS